MMPTMRPEFESRLADDQRSAIVADEFLHDVFERGIRADRMNHVALNVKNFTQVHGLSPNLI